MTFPPAGGSARILSGLGVPDIKGGLGNYTFYTAKAPNDREEGREKVVIVQVAGDSVQT